MPQSIDELLKSIAGLDPSIGAKFAQIDQDANRQIQGLASNPSSADPFLRDVVPGVVEGATRFGRTVGSDLGNTALGLGKMLITPPAQLAMEQGGQLAADYAERGAGSAGVSAAEGLSGLPLRQIGSD